MNSCNDLRLIEQILWFFANISGDSVKYRDIILKETSVLATLSYLTGHN